MASKQANLDFVLEQLADARDVTARKMFGEYGIYSAGKLVALFCDDQLFVKPSDEGRSFIGKVREAPPYPGAKLWFLVSGDRWEDGEWLSELIRITERALPAPKPKSPKMPKKSGTKKSATKQATTKKKPKTHARAAASKAARRAPKSRK